MYGCPPASLSGKAESAMSLRTLGRLALVAAPLSALSARAAAAGDATSDPPLRAARDLFLAAERDEDAGRWAEALEKLRRVALVKLTSGVRYHTALCEEHLGRLVAALSDYQAAADQARVERAADVLRLVDGRVSDSTERVPRITIVLVPSVPDATVRLDGHPIPAGEAVLADPGTHSLDADAPGRKTSATTVTVQEHDAARVEIALEPDTPPLVLPPATAERAAETHEPAPLRPEHKADSRDRTVALIAGASAIVLGAGGVGAYLVAGREHDESVQTCAQLAKQAGACDPQKNTVRAWDWVGIGAWAGAAAAGAVAVLSLVRVHHDSARGSAHPTRTASLFAHVVVGPASMGVEGTF
jgi:hypothetical protein